MDTQTVDVNMMEAGPGLDALIVERVLRMPVYWSGVGSNAWAGPFLQRTHDYPYAASGDGGSRIVLYLANDKADYWSPSTDIAAAWQVVEHIWATRNIPINLGRSFDLKGESNAWSCRFGGLDDNVFALADTMPLAICRAALKAIPNALTPHKPSDRG